MTRSVQGRSGLLDGTVQPKAVLRRFHGDYGGLRVAHGEKSRRQVDLPRRKPGRNSRACVEQGEGKAAGDAPGAKKELLRRPVEAGRPRSGVPAEAQSSVPL